MRCRDQRYLYTQQIAMVVSWTLSTSVCNSLNVVTFEAETKHFLRGAKAEQIIRAIRQIYYTES